MFAPSFPASMHGEFSFSDKPYSHSSGGARSRNGRSALPSPPSGLAASTNTSVGPAKPQKSGSVLMLPSPGQRSSVSMQEKVTSGWAAVSESIRAPPALPHTMQLARVGGEFELLYTPPPLLAQFPEIVLFVRVGEEFKQYTPPPWPFSAEFPEIVQFVRVGEEFSSQYTPPPPGASCADDDTEFPEIVQFVRVGEEPKQYTPPPLYDAEFSEIVQFVRVGEEPEPQYTPPPPPDSAEFPEIVQFVRVGEDLSQYTPPPRVAEFPEIVQFVKVGEEIEQYTPPPEYALFPEIVQLVRVGEEL